MNDWQDPFAELFKRILARVRAGERNADALFSAADRAFLRSIGSKPIELFDACDDFLSDGAPTFEETLKIHEIRRDHFLHVQHGTFPPLQTSVRSRTDELGGIVWLPRAIDKARAKLEGRLPDELYYPCGGDRRMLRELGLGRVEFFEIVRDHAMDDAILGEVRRRMKKSVAA